MLITLGGIAVLLILSAFFSGSETALTAASRPLMPQLEQGGDAKARTVNDLLARKERLIGTILLGNNLVNILASALATSVLITMFGETGIAYATLVVVVNSLQYPAATKVIIYIAGLNLFFKTTATTLFDRFQAREKMKYIAYSNLISGALLTLFSVIVIYIGYRLLGITIVYVAGSLILVLAIAVYYRLHFKTIKFSVDTRFWRESVKKGLPFFLSAMLWMLNMRICIVLLSKMTDNASVGLYGAAFNIVSKLYIFPDSIGTAIFPTIAMLYAHKNMSELDGLCEKFFRYVLLIGMPFSIGIALLSPQIINLIYGADYGESGLVLSVLSCGIPFLFMIGLFGFALGAVHLQNKALKANVIATVCNVIVTVLLIPHINENGAAVGFSVSQLVTAALMFFYFRRFLPFKLDVKAIFIILAANAVMGGLVVLTRDINLALAILAPGAAYLGLVLLLRAVNKDDLGLIKDAFIARKKRRAAPDGAGD